MEIAGLHTSGSHGPDTQSMPTTGVIIADVDLRVMHVQGMVFPRHGYTPVDWLGRPLREVLPAAALAELEPRYRAALAGEDQTFDYRSDDRSSAYWVQIAPVRGKHGVVSSVVAVMQDVTERLIMMQDLLLSEAHLRESERMVGVGSWEWVPETGVLTYSPGFARLLGLAAAEKLDARGFWRLLAREDRDLLSRVTRDCQSTGFASSEFRVHRSDGNLRTFAAQAETVAAGNGRLEYLRGAILDVTEEREAERRRLDAASLFRQAFDASPIGMAMTDPQTGAYTRVNDALCTLLQRPRAEVLRLTIDSVTHPDDRAANQALREVLSNQDVKSHHVEKRYLRPDGSSLWISGHVTSVRDAKGSLQALFSQIIDITERKEREAQFETQVNDALWLGRIRDALDRDRFVLYRQPIVDLFTGETVQHELLIRMLAEDGSIIAPGEFLPVAERYGLISEIDRWVIGEAVGLAAEGQPTEFNLSGASIGDPDIVRELASGIEHTGADPSLLVVEVTETAMMNQLDAGRRFAEQVTALGCRLALDDFGTGYASLSYLKRIPAQHLKIDIEFVRDLTHNDTDERLVRGIIGIAREFDQTTIAEGIEDEATLVRLRELGVDFGQGYLLGRPQPLADSTPAVAFAPRSDTAGSNPIGMVRTALAAIVSHDIDTLLEVCHPDVVLRTPGTSEQVGRRKPYRGHEGLRAYVKDTVAVWKHLQLTPTTFRLSNQSVIVFGRIDADSGTHSQSIDVLWVWQLHDGLIASVEVFPTPARDPLPTSLSPPAPFAPVKRPHPPMQAHSQTPVTPAEGSVATAVPERRANPARRPRKTATDRLVLAYGETLRDGDPHAAAAVIDDAVGHGLSSVEVQSRVIAPVMRGIGELWERGDLTVAQEHLATALSHHALARLYPGLLRQTQRRGDTIVVAAAHGEHHVLGLRMAADVLEGAGFDVRFLGTDVPEDSLLAWVSEHRPAAVALGVTMPLRATTLLQQLQALRKYDPEIRLIVGGQGVPQVLRESTAVFYASDTEALAEYLDRAVSTGPTGDLPSHIADGGVSSGRVPGVETDLTVGLEARMTQTAAAAADAARGQARRAFGLEQIAFRDQLTGLWSRRAFDDRYQSITAGEIAPAPAILMIDVDRFKSVNDRFGHDAGDRTLIEVAQCITRALRSEDFAARYAGDEFVVLLPDTSANAAAEIGERIRGSVRSELADHSVTVSIGVSVPDHADRRRATLDVDRALYEAKERGRDQIAVA
jgi:diguanylate cyclase (GGDEF)-like protein/PAS domain S-box-containing protein